MLSIPTLSELYAQNISDLETEFGTSINQFGKVGLKAFAAVQASKQRIQYLAISFVLKNVWPDQADTESQGGTLERFGRVKLGRNPFPAVAGEYTVQLTGTLGTVVPGSTTFKSDDDSNAPGLLYVLDNQFTLDGVDVVQLRSLNPGLEARLVAGNTLSVTQPIAGLDAVSTVILEVIEPKSAESVDDYRNDIIRSFRLTPQGGAGSDYRLWASEVQGVLNSYPYAKSGSANEIDFFIEATTVDSIDGDGTPSSALLDDVKDAIELPTIDRPSRKPLTVFNINYLPITVKYVEIFISGFQALTPAIEASIGSAIDLELKRTRPFVSSIDVVSEINDTVSKNKIISIITATVPGSAFGAVTIEVGGVLVDEYKFEGGEIPVFDVINFV